MLREVGYKGPTWAKKGNFIEDASGTRLAVVLEEEGQDDKHALLLTAAPDLYDALESLYFDAVQHNSFDYCSYCCGEAEKDEKGRVIGNIKHNSSCSIVDARNLLSLLCECFA